MNHWIISLCVQCSTLMLIESAKDSLSFSVTHYKHPKQPHTVQVRPPAALQLPSACLFYTCTGWSEQVWSAVWTFLFFVGFMFPGEDGGGEEAVGSSHQTHHSGKPPRHHPTEGQKPVQPVYTPVYTPVDTPVSSPASKCVTFAVLCFRRRRPSWRWIPSVSKCLFVCIKNSQNEDFRCSPVRKRKQETVSLFTESPFKVFIFIKYQYLMISMIFYLSTLTNTTEEEPVWLI